MPSLAWGQRRLGHGRATASRRSVRIRHAACPDGIRVLGAGAAQPAEVLSAVERVARWIAPFSLHQCECFCRVWDRKPFANQSNARFWARVW